MKLIPRAFLQLFPLTPCVLAEWLPRCYFIVCKCFSSLGKSSLAVVIQWESQILSELTHTSMTPPFLEAKDSGLLLYCINWMNCNSLRAEKLSVMPVLDGIMFSNTVIDSYQHQCLWSGNVLSENICE